MSDLSFPSEVLSHELSKQRTYMLQWLSNNTDSESVSTASDSSKKRKPYQKRLENGRKELDYQLLDGNGGKVVHSLRHFSDRENQKQKTRSKCRYCGSNTYYYCYTCSNFLNKKIPMCNVLVHALSVYHL